MPESATLSDVATSDIAPNSASAHSLFSPSCAADVNSDEPKTRTPRSRPTHHPFVSVVSAVVVSQHSVLDSVDSCVVVVLTFSDEVDSVRSDEVVDSVQRLVDSLVVVERVAVAVAVAVMMKASLDSVVEMNSSSLKGFGSWKISSKKNL